MIGLDKGWGKPDPCTPLNCASRLSGSAQGALYRRTVQLPWLDNQSFFFFFLYCLLFCCFLHFSIINLKVILKFSGRLLCWIKWQLGILKVHFSWPLPWVSVFFHLSHLTCKANFLLSPLIKFDYKVVCCLWCWTGDSWSHSCTNRIILYWNGDERHAFIDKSPSLKSASAPYSVTTRGIRNSTPSSKRIKMVWDFWVERLSIQLNLPSLFLLVPFFNFQDITRWYNTFLYFFGFPTILAFVQPQSTESFGLVVLYA